MHLLFSLLVLGTGAALASNSGPFDPRRYSKQTAVCSVDADHEIKIHYVDVNPTANTTIVMVHGWPAIWSTWSKQIQEFENDYHLIVPDLPGFGASTHPGNGRGTMGELVGDVVCVLQHARVDAVVCLGHDWGSQICHEGSRMRPDVFIAVAGTIPYLPNAGPYVPIAALVPVLPRLSYQRFFDEQTKDAVVELNRDIRRTLRATLRTSTSPVPPRFLTNSDSFMAEWDEYDEIPSIEFFTADEEDYLVEQFSLQKFDNTLYFYNNTNRFLSWEFDQKQGNYTITNPILWIFPLDDPVADWEAAVVMLKSVDYAPRSVTKTLRGSHWPHQEKPREFNRFLRDWLATEVVRSPPDEWQARNSDEL